ncbi:chromosome segregation protein [Ophiostoma piceae UAMH 11346]|uniref:Chromosome segregation protein n=1 Tax=Ophiostoma piceae (strain UAMH 11346) TaxID=1262450 RepID=S3D4L9_OPHP1|nr:chromosome segregation protein [Ophiostoma piceae UAMH 11346]
MARTKAPSNLLGLVDSDSEDDLGGFKNTATNAKVTAKPTKPTTSSSIRDMPAAKRGRPAAATAAANKVTKPAQKKAAAKPRAGGRGGAAAAAALKAAEAEEDNDDDDAANTTTSSADSRGRPALADRTNELAEAEPEPAPKEKAKPRGRPGRKPAAANTATETDDSIMEEAPTVAAPKKRGRGRPKASDENNDPVAAAKPAKKGRAAAVAKETTEDVSMEEEGDEPQKDTTVEPAVEMEAETAEKRDTATDDTAHNTFQSPLRRNKTQLLAAAASPARPRGSTAATATDDASVRRRLGELTKKYDTLEARYRDLKEIGVKEAERNFDRLKKQGEERAKTSNDLIASLKAELATYRDLAKEGARAKREWDASEARAVDLQAQLCELKTALGNAKAESKTLSTKLAAARTTNDASLSAGVIPGSAMKSSIAGKSSSAPANASTRAAVEAMHASTQISQLKEDLYGDLTGLLVRSAKRDGSREMYDCIQTGRNGSLHFKLCIDDEASTDGEDAQFVYTPQLDPSRDAALVEMLPDYLVEEISFPRMQAAKFYKRVMQSLTEEL